jgi:serine O-acetyltransferase
VDQISVNNPTLEKLSAINARLELVEKLLDEKYLEEKHK